MADTVHTDGGLTGPDGRAEEMPVQDAWPRLAGVDHRFVQIPSLRMHVAEAGNPDAPTVLLLHGFPQHWWEWRKVIPPLAERSRVVAPDLRGAGWTDAPADGYTVGDVLADVLDAARRARAPAGRAGRPRLHRVRWVPALFRPPRTCRRLPV